MRQQVLATPGQLRENQAERHSAAQDIAAEEARLAALPAMQTAWAKRRDRRLHGLAWIEVMYSANPAKMHHWPGPSVKPAPTVAVLIPCYNEAITVGRVVDQFKRVLPQATIFVFDNNSTDGTAQIAREHGAQVVTSLRQGKGNVVRHMFEAVDADIYLMVDGDDTYPAEAAGDLIHALCTSGADMVVGSRLSRFDRYAFRRFHFIGNRMVSRLISQLFGVSVRDVLSGYRAFSRDFAKTVPLVSQGFEIETELTLQAAAKQFSIIECPITYLSRPEGSVSKLNTFSDGYLILRAIFTIFKDYKPLIFFWSVSAALALISLAAGALPIMEYYQTAVVRRVPLAVLAAGIGILSSICFGVGLILDTMNRYHNEMFQLHRRLLNSTDRRATLLAVDHPDVPVPPHKLLR